MFEPDLAHPATTRWSGFTSAAVDAGARAIFGFPIAIGDIHIGALDLYRDRPGALTADQHADALLIADVAARAILTMQSAAPLGALAEPLEARGNFRFVVHQAAGMVAVRLSIPVADALLRLRARAFATGRTVSDVATDVVNRRLRLDTLEDG